MERVGSGIGHQMNPVPVGLKSNRNLGTKVTMLERYQVVVGEETA